MLAIILKLINAQIFSLLMGHLSMVVVIKYGNDHTATSWNAISTGSSSEMSSHEGLCSSLPRL